MVFGAVPAGPDHTDDEQNVADPRGNIMQLQLLAEQEIIKDDQRCTDQSHQERFVRALASCLIYVPEGVGEQTAAQGNEIRVYTSRCAPKRCQIAGDCVGVDGEALAVSAQCRSRLSQRIKHSGETCGPQEAQGALLASCDGMRPPFLIVAH